ncbi:MAG: CAP domain-containing protein [Anaerolineae bacterium]
MSILRSVPVVIRVSLFAILAGVLAYFPVPTAAQQIDNNTTIATQTVAQINDWRISQGLWPLAVNPTLEAMALAQANYILPLLSSVADESAYHLDAQRRNPRQRGFLAGWPIYNAANPDQIEVGENAGVGGLAFIMNFWKGSAIHAKAALSTTYREIGVAALPRPKGGYLIYTVFGARPAVLPALISADETKLYLTRENSRYAGTVDTTRVQLLDAAGNPLSDPVSWKAQLDIPASAGETFEVQYSYGSTQTTTIVTRSQGLVLLPSTVGKTSSPVQVVAATPTPQEVAVQPTAAPIQPTSTPVVLPSVTPTPALQATTAPTQQVVQPTAAPVQPTATINPVTADLLLTYDNIELVAINNTSAPVDLTGLSLIGSGVTVGVQLWSRVGDLPVTAFPSSHCVMVRLINSGAQVPSSCKWTRSIVDLTPAKIFWTLDDFIVTQNGTLLATCSKSAGQCAVDLP